MLVAQVPVVIDYRKLNPQTIPDKFPLPNVNDLLNQLLGSKYFTTIDLATGFHQIEMHEDYSIFHRHYEFTRMPFGLCNAPPTFQRAMNMLLFNVPNTLVYIDAVLIFSKTKEDH